MKFNWGYKIATFYILFVAGILYLVVKANHQKIDLVSDNYYEEELKYQERIEEMTRVQKLSESVKVNIEGSHLAIKFPKDFKGNKINGNVQVYYPADEKKDMSFTFETENNLISHELNASNKGMHVIKLRWMAQNTSYYTEQNIFIH